MRQDGTFSLIFEFPWRLVGVAGRGLVTPQVQIHAITVWYQVELEADFPIRQGINNRRKLVDGYAPVPAP